jgi:glycosyltransferase involved in cell wall biosynthesis
MNKNITICICTLELLKGYNALKELSKNFKCIIVCPDNDYIERKNILILIDEKKGLGQARNIALERTETKYILYMSDDNIITKEQIEDQIKYLEENNYTWLGFLTRIKEPRGYWNKCLEMRWEKRFYEGERDRAGMPCIIRTDILKKIKFVDGYCDDIQCCQEMQKQGYKIGYSNIIVYEDNWDYKDLKARFIMYGKSDKSFYKNNKNNWNFLYKCYIFLRVVKDEWQWNLYFIPFYFWILWQRYKVRLGLNK